MPTTFVLFLITLASVQREQPMTHSEVAALVTELNAGITGTTRTDTRGPISCTELEKISKRLRDRGADENSDTALLRELLRELRRAAKCPPGTQSTKTKVRHTTLWTAFQTARTAWLETPSVKQLSDVSERVPLLGMPLLFSLGPSLETLSRETQKLLSLAALPLLRTISVTDARFPQLLSVLSLHVLSEDAVRMLDQIAGSLSEKDLSGKRGQVIAASVVNLLDRLPAQPLDANQFDAVLKFFQRLSHANPDWCTAEHAGPIVDFLVRLSQQDPALLASQQGGTLLVVLTGLMEHFNLPHLKREQLDAVMSLVAKIAADSTVDAESIQTTVQHWQDIRQIVDTTRDPKRRKILLSAIEEVCKRNGGCPEALAKEVEKTEPDPRMVSSLLITIGIAQAERIRAQQAKLEREQIPLAAILRRQVLVVPKRLEECRTDRPTNPICDKWRKFTTAFGEMVTGASLHRGNTTAEVDYSLDAMLEEAACTLASPSQPSAGTTPCAMWKNSPGFGSFVGIELRPQDQAGNGAVKYIAHAACVVRVLDGQPARSNEFSSAYLSSAADEQVFVGEALRLGEQVLDGCPVGRPEDGLSSFTLTNQKPSPRAAGALLFAGLPYLIDKRPGKAPPAWAGWTLAGLDAGTLLLAAGSLAGAVWAHNTNHTSSDNLLLRTGLVLTLLNISVKGTGYGFYRHSYEDDR